MNAMGHRIAIAWAAFFLLALGAAAQETKSLTIAVPSAVKPISGYTGKLRIQFEGVEDKRLLDDPQYLGIAQTGLFNKQTPLRADQSVRDIVDMAVRQTLKADGVLAETPDSATLRLSVRLFSLAYAEETFAASEYGMAEALLLAEFTPVALPGGPAPQARQVLIRSFEVKKAGDVTKYASPLVQAVVQQGVARLLGSDTLSSYLEPESAGLFRQTFSESEDLKKWIAKSAKKLGPAENFVSAKPVDLSAFTTLKLGEVRIADEKYKPRADMAEKELRQVLYAMLMGTLSKKFERIISGEPEPGSKCAELSFLVKEYAPMRPGTQATMAVLFGIAGAAAGHGRLKGTMVLKDASTGASLAELPFESRVGVSSSEAMLERLATSVESYMQRTKPDAASTTVEVSWAEG